MALHNIKLGKLRRRSVGKTRLAIESVAEGRVNRQGFPAGGIFPLTGDQRHVQGRILRQHVQRAGDKTLRAAVGVIGLSDDSQLHAGFSSSRVSMALSTICGVIAVMQSETPLSPQPALPQG